MRAPVVLLCGLIIDFTLSACGASTITDSNSPQAQQCKAALQARVDTADAAAADAPNDTAAQAAIANSLAGTRPEECAHISDALGAKLLNGLAAAATTRASAARASLRDGLRQAAAMNSPIPTTSPASTP